MAAGVKSRGVSWCEHLCDASDVDECGLELAVMVSLHLILNSTAGMAVATIICVAGCSIPDLTIVQCLLVQCVEHFL
jgi:hypothetical protein